MPAAGRTIRARQIRLPLEEEEEVIRTAALVVAVECRVGKKSR